MTTSDNLVPLFCRNLSIFFQLVFDLLDQFVTITLRLLCRHRMAASHSRQIAEKEVDGIVYLLESDVSVRGSVIELFEAFAKAR